MDLNWIESLLFSFTAGIAEILPVSSQAHEALLLKLFGTTSDPLMKLLIHAAVWEALFLAMRRDIDQMMHAARLARVPSRRRNRQPDPVRLLDVRLLQTAVIPLLLGFLAYPALSGWYTDLSKVAVLLFVNGLILCIPRYLRSANKDSRSMTGFDGLLLGISGALAVLPGISRIGAVSSAAAGRGADREHAIRWAFLLDLAALLVLICFDIYNLYILGISAVSVPTVVCYILSAAAAFGGAALGIYMMRFLAVHAGFSGFAYYSWGAALFAFLMYLTI